jgi:hypothetical protein
MWIQNGKAFVWVEHEHGGIDFIGERPAQMFGVMPGLALARVLLPRDITLLPNDTLAGTLDIEFEEEELGPGPWIA